MVGDVEDRQVGAPPDLVTCVSNPTIESTGALMKHKHVALILSTGGPGLVKASYSSGKPAYGVGPGNVPVYMAGSTAHQLIGARGMDIAPSFDPGSTAPVLHQLINGEFLSGSHPWPANIGLGFFVRGAAITPGPIGNLASAPTFGGWGAGSTAFWVDPERDLSFSFLSTGLMEDSRHIDRVARLHDLALAALVE